MAVHLRPGGGDAEQEPGASRGARRRRARLETASKAQRETGEAMLKLQRRVEELQAAAREKDAEVGRLRAEAAGARTKLQEAHQADASRRGRWEAAYLELILGANRKLDELRDCGLGDPGTSAKNPNFKESESCANLSQNTAEHDIASNLGTELRKLKQAYEILSSKKDKEVSALLSERDFVCDQMSIMEQDFAALLKKLEAAQATESAQKLQQNINELQVLAEKKDDEISRLRAKAVSAKEKIDYLQLLVKEKDDEIERLKGGLPETIPKRNKDISETHKRSRNEGPAVWTESKNSCPRTMIEEDFASEIEMAEKHGQAETSKKPKYASSLSNSGNGGDGDEQSGHDEDGDEQSGGDKDDELIGTDEDGDEQSGTDEDSDEQSGTDEDGNEQSGSDDGSEDVDEQNREDERIWKGQSTMKCSLRKYRNGQSTMKSTGNWALFVSDVNDILADRPDRHKRFIDFLHTFRHKKPRIDSVASTMECVLDGHPDLVRRFNKNRIEVKTKWRPVPGGQRSHQGQRGGEVGKEEKPIFQTKQIVEPLNQTLPKKRGRPRARSWYSWKRGEAQVH
ncbi:SWR1-complex protein 3 isoform X2 [Brachypodium distachyon]|uniref:SWR1-complex protein 3 isoform X2 n=1 Tax=Brachypodium distachyon TaxID=15368 RepID=UPI00052FE7B4|nr:SWR1-complex protein 3 isoform X2 [Brachypodium distachyon]|eukprot:XP_010233712.1 SWR1-complex protein 3 isoform X2 [Brachypodium distachyon]